MTGYAAVTADSPRGRLALELRSVNSRFLDLQFRIVDELRTLEPVLRERIAGRVARGKVDCRLSFAQSGVNAGPQNLNADVLARLKALAAEATRAFPQAAPLRIADVLKWPGVVSEPQGDEDAMRSIASSLCDDALEEFVAARSREGAKLADTVRDRVKAMRSAVDKVVPLLPEAMAAYQAKLVERLKDAVGTSLDEERIRAEVALFAAKVDVDEELTRLRAHFAEVERALQKGGVAGKRLDFLAQELNREANTLGAKAASPAISDCALELKLLVEQVREQVQNIE
jgi:uncharacterized protein (TIGR00255 family)